MSERAPPELSARDLIARVARVYMAPRWKSWLVALFAAIAVAFFSTKLVQILEPAVNDLEGAFCYDIDDLRAVVESNLKERQREAQRAQALLEREVDKFAGRLQQLEVVPTIVSLREKLEAIRRAELERALARLPGAAEDTRRVMDALSQAIVNKVLHAPMVKLKDSSRAGHGRRWTEMISELFGLRGSGPGRSE